MCANNCPPSDRDRANAICQFELQHESPLLKKKNPERVTLCDMADGTSPIVLLSGYANGPGLAHLVLTLRSIMEKTGRTTGP